MSSHHNVAQCVLHTRVLTFFFLLVHIFVNDVVFCSVLVVCERSKCCNNINSKKKHCHYHCKLISQLRAQILSYLFEQTG